MKIDLIQVWQWWCFDVHDISQVQRSTQKSQKGFKSSHNYSIFEPWTYNVAPCSNPPSPLYGGMSLIICCELSWADSWLPSHWRPAMRDDALSEDWGPPNLDHLLTSFGCRSTADRRCKVDFVTPCKKKKSSRRSWGGSSRVCHCGLL